MYEEMLQEEYKKYSYKKLKEITVANGYTKEAEKIATRIIREKEEEFKENIQTQQGALTVHEDTLEDIEAQEEIQAIKESIEAQEKMQATQENTEEQQVMQVSREDVSQIHNSAMKVHCRIIAWLGSIFGVLLTCLMLSEVWPLSELLGPVGAALILLTFVVGAFIIYVIWILWNTFAEILEKLAAVDGRLRQMEKRMEEK